MSAEELANTVPAGYAWTVDTPSAPDSGNAQRFRRFRCTLITRARLDFWPAAEDGYKAVTRLTVSAMNLRPPVAAGEPVPPPAPASPSSIVRPLASAHNGPLVPGTFLPLQLLRNPAA